MRFALTAVIGLTLSHAQEPAGIKFQLVAYDGPCRTGCLEAVNPFLAALDLTTLDATSLTTLNTLLSNSCPSTIFGEECLVEIAAYYHQPPSAACELVSRLDVRLPQPFWDSSSPFILAPVISVLTPTCENVQVLGFSQDQNACTDAGTPIKATATAPTGTIELEETRLSMAVLGCSGSGGVSVTAVGRYHVEFPITKDEQLHLAYTLSGSCPENCEAQLTAAVNAQPIATRVETVNTAAATFCASTKPSDVCEINVAAIYKSNPDTVCETRLGIKMPAGFWTPALGYQIEPQVDILGQHRACDGSTEDIPQVRQYPELASNVCEDEGVVVENSRYCDPPTSIAFDEGYRALTVNGCTAADAEGLQLFASTTVQTPYDPSTRVYWTHEMTRGCPDICRVAVEGIFADSAVQDKAAAVRAMIAERGICNPILASEPCNIPIVATYVEKAGERCGPTGILGIRVPDFLVGTESGYILNDELAIIAPHTPCTGAETEGKAQALYFAATDDMCTATGTEIAGSSYTDDTYSVIRIGAEPHQSVAVSGCTAASAQGLEIRAAAALSVEWTSIEHLAVDFVTSEACPSKCRDALLAYIGGAQQVVAGKLDEINRIAEESCKPSVPDANCDVTITAGHTVLASAGCGADGRLTLSLLSEFTKLGYLMDNTVHVIGLEKECNGPSMSGAQAVYFEEGEDICLDEGHPLQAVFEENRLVITDPKFPLAIEGCVAADAHGLYIKGVKTQTIAPPPRPICRARRAAK